MMLDDDNDNNDSKPTNVTNDYKNNVGRECLQCSTNKIKLWKIVEKISNTSLENFYKA